MIRINLLPKEERKRRRKAAAPKTNLILGVFGAVVAVGLMGYFWWVLRGQLTSLQQQIDQANAELIRQKAIAQQVDQFKKDLGELEKRLGVIKRLEAMQGGPGSPVHMLDDLSAMLPKDVWLASMSRGPNRLAIQGYAFSNFGVADFMTALSKMPSAQSVDLSYSEKTEIEKVSLERFEIIVGLKG